MRYSGTQISTRGNLVVLTPDEPEEWVDGRKILT